MSKKAFNIIKLLFEYNIQEEYLYISNTLPCAINCTLLTFEEEVEDFIYGILSE